MNNVPKGQRKVSRFEAEHHFYRLRADVTTLMLLDFGFSEEKYRKSIERYRQTHANAQNVDEVVERYKKKCESFKRWFIDRECDAVLEILRRIGSEFKAGNSIYPSETPAKIMEFCERRKHMDEAVAQCHVLKQELQYIICSLPVNVNRYERLAVDIDMQIALYKGVRQADNRFLKTKKGKDKTGGTKPDGKSGQQKKKSGRKETGGTGPDGKSGQQKKKTGEKETGGAKPDGKSAQPEK